MTKTAERHDPFSIPQTSFFPADSRKAASALAHMQGQAFQAMLRYQVEALGFLRRRFEKDIKLVDDLIESGEHGDTFDVYADFMREAISDYTDEAGKLAKLESRLASDTARQIREEAKTINEDIAVAAAV